MLIDSFHLHCVHSVLGVRDGKLVDPFELTSVLRVRKGIVVDTFDLNILQKVRNMCWLIHLTF